MKLKKLISAAISSCLFMSTFTCIGSYAANQRVSVHDPSIIKADGTYYVFGSHIEAAKTNDLKNWRRFSNGYATKNNVEFGDLSQNLKKAFAWAGEDLEDCAGGFAVWAPDVVWDADFINSDGSKGAYLMYFCTSSTYMRSVIAYAASKTIEGPYTFVDTLIYSGFTNNDAYVKSSTKNVNKKYTSTNIDELIAAGQVSFNNNWFRNNDYNNQLFPNAIDPTIYYDTNGKMYMCYGSWSGGIFTLEIDPKTGQCIHPKTGTTSDGRMIDSYFGTKISGGYGKSGEGPFIEYNADTGYYYLWVTYGGLTSTGGYNMRVFRSVSPTGPFTDPAGRQAVLPTNPNLDATGLKVMGNYKFSSLSKAYMACGHNSVLRDDDGKWYLVYHTRFDDGAEFHEVRVHSMYFNEEGWPVAVPYEYAGDEISATGYDDNDIIGEYEFINHGTSTDGKIIGYSNIKLNADGSISGAVIGKWTQAQDSAAAEITIGGQGYSGYFLAAKDENGKKVMSFTAVGKNNQTIWGVQTKEFTGKDRSGLADFTDTNSQLINKADTVSGSGAAVKLSGTELISGVPYYIINQNSGMAIDLPNGKLDAGTNIQQWERNGSWAQQWRIIAVDKNYCRIVSVGNESMCIAAAQSSADDGVNIELQKYEGKDNQLFKIKKCGSDYGIVSKCSGDTGGLDVYEWSKENGGNVNQWNYWEGSCQLWSLSPVHPQVTDGNYMIRSIDNELFIFDMNGKVTQFDARGKSVQPDMFGNMPFTLNDQIWSFTKLSDGCYTIKNQNGQALAVDGSDKLTVETATGGNDQKFKIICNKDGSYSFFCNDVCIEIEKNDTDEAGFFTNSFTGAYTQKFVLEPAVPEEIKRTVKGDINGDDILDIADLVMLQKFLLNNSPVTRPELSDINGDGMVDIFDSIALRKLLISK
ncbi:MAG: RICIN domain-containing protein [Ruminococcus sp.]|uniref:RICIN domain-containing protein n=1 Tax=Ruminococcus sp. TaxID=41978 RepID=UPI0025D2FC2B|nr:RICIN domain-containing protein [Ruminococcus sp.]MCR4796049.1 RICIN domain-containing protein [Ruminococcus sp.]